MAKKVVKKKKRVVVRTKQTVSNAPMEEGGKGDDGSTTTTPPISRSASMTSVPGLDKARRVPNSLKTEGRGAEIVARQDEFVSLEMDIGSFVWLWELAEQRTLGNWQRYSEGPSSLAPHLDACKRACLSLRVAYHGPEKKPKKKVTKKKPTTVKKIKRIKK